jgi:Ca2+-dependent lipid-binding protein
MMGKIMVNCDMMSSISRLSKLKKASQKYWTLVRRLNKVDGEVNLMIFFCQAVGIVRLMIHQAKELDKSKSLSGDLNPLCQVRVNTTSGTFKSPIKKHTNSPVWEVPYEFLCLDKNATKLSIKVLDDRDFIDDPVIGYMTINLVDLLQTKDQASQDWFPLSGCHTGKVRLSAEWKPLSMAGSLHGSDQYTPPIGVVRLVIDRALDVKYVSFATSRFYY